MEGKIRNKEKVIIVHLNTDASTDCQVKLDELKELVRSCHGEVLAQVVQNAGAINATYYIGSGKVEEIRDLAEKLEADTVVFNHELTGSQMRNLEELIDKKIVDRTGLILDIFARRATSSEGKLQVKLAQLEYRLPRLVGYRKYLSREGAGIGTRGPGEQKLEIDRRIVQREISVIKEKLKDQDIKREIKRKRRVEARLPIVSLIGYTNAGKSTILNAFVNRDDKPEGEVKTVYSDNLLFATLDVASRVVKLSNKKEIILSDTVGFISDLPTKLVESFKSSLEEIEYSDLLLLVVDASNEDYEMQIRATMDVLKDMNIDSDKIIYIYNKTDLLDKKIFVGKKDKEFICISAKEFEDINRLDELMVNKLYGNYEYYDIFVAYKDVGLFNSLYRLDENEKIYNEAGFSGKIYIDKKQKEKFSRFIVDGKGI